MSPGSLGSTTDGAQREAGWWIVSMAGWWAVSAWEWGTRPMVPAARPRVCHDRRMELTFLGGARTVTGSRYLLDTGRARVLIDCGMFQGSPNETVRNRVPLGFDPATIDAVLLTHAHLDHCGFLPVVVREGSAGPIY